MEQQKQNYCERGFRWFPCVFILLVVLWSYYAYVVELCIYTIDNVPQKVLYIIFYQGFFIMFLWSFSKTVFTDPMNPTHEYTFPEGMFERIIAAKSEGERQEVIKDFAANCNGMEVRNHNGGYRYCMVTGRLKPDRCHYCSVVKQCVLKMDHYCPWVNNCVGYSNYKFFCLFLFYGLLYCLYVAATSLEYFLLFWQDNFPSTSSTAKLMILFLFFAAAMFAFSLTTLFFYHLWLVLKNKTTIESWRPAHFRHGPDSSGFNLGSRRNFEQVFGESPLKWLMPVFTSLGDGQSFPTRLVQNGDVENGFGTTRNGNSIRSSNSNGKSKASTLQFDEK